MKFSASSLRMSREKTRRERNVPHWSLLNEQDNPYHCSLTRELWVLISPPHSRTICRELKSPQLLVDTRPALNFKAGSKHESALLTKYLSLAKLPAPAFCPPWQGGLQGVCYKLMKTSCREKTREAFSKLRFPWKMGTNAE